MHDQGRRREDGRLPEYATLCMTRQCRREEGRGAESIRAPISSTAGSAIDRARRPLPHVHASRGPSAPGRARLPRVYRRCGRGPLPQPAEHVVRCPARHVRVRGRRVGRRRERATTPPRIAQRSHERRHARGAAGRAQRFGGRGADAAGTMSEEWNQRRFRAMVAEQLERAHCGGGDFTRGIAGLGDEPLVVRRRDGERDRSSHERRIVGTAAARKATGRDLAGRRRVQCRKQRDRRERDPCPREPHPPPAPRRDSERAAAARTCGLGSSSACVSPTTARVVHVSSGSDGTCFTGECARVASVRR